MNEYELCKKLKQSGISAESLDELVHQACSITASNINNAGIDSQVEYLMENGYTYTDILTELEVE